MNITHLAVLGVLASSAICQIPIPSHASTYNGYSRGFNFTANTRFFINKLDLPTNAFQTGDTASYMIHVNGVEVLRSVGNAGALTLATPLGILSGDVVNIIGNWSPAVTNNFTAHNSYGSTAPYNTMIEGVAHVLNRVGWQWDIGDSAYMSGSMLAPGTGSIGRVLVHTIPPTGLFPSFKATPSSGSAPLSVTFTDTSFSSRPNGVLSRVWDFGDGTPTVTGKTVTHSYKCGTFSPKLTVLDSVESKSITMTGLIKAGIVKASFTENTTGGFAPLSVTFTDTSTGGPTGWTWDFGDGTPTSSVQNPTHIYTANGVYDVKLTASTSCNRGTVTKTKLITVGQNRR